MPMEIPSSLLRTQWTANPIETFRQEKCIGTTERPQRYKRHLFQKDVTEAIRSLTTDNWHGIAYILKDYAIIATLAYIVATWQPWLYPVALLLIGAHQRGIATAMHDAAHGILAKNTSLNFVLGTIVTAWPLVQMYFPYRESHVSKHHPDLGRAGRDPDLDFFIEQGVFTPKPDREFVRKIVILPILGSKLWSYYRYLMRHRLGRLLARPADATQHNHSQPVNWKQRFDAIGFTTFWTSICIIGVWQGLWWYILLFWLAPYLTAFHIIGWFIELSEHCTASEQRTVDVSMARNRRSRHLEKWLTGINADHYHLDHHLYPRTPFWLLPKAHAIRMHDAVYAAHCLETGGLFQSGTDGAPSIISLLREQNRERLRRSQKHFASGSAAEIGPP